MRSFIAAHALAARLTPNERQTMQPLPNTTSMQQCQWFALCTNPATQTLPHPVLGDVPVCDRCAALVAELDPEHTPATALVDPHSEPARGLKGALGYSLAQVPEQLECLDGPNGCEGAVEYRTPLSGTGKSFPRCDAHWALRLKTQREVDERYPALAPSDFDPADAGEQWDEDL